jgi:uncharacterized protein YhjY with autotransporter beta-barrel domain
LLLRRAEYGMRRIAITATLIEPWVRKQHARPERDKGVAMSMQLDWRHDFAPRPESPPNRRRPPANSRQHPRLTPLALALGAAFLAWQPMPGSAAPGPCTADDATTDSITCSSAHASGIASGADFNSPARPGPYSNLRVENLLGGITPTAGKAGIHFRADNGADLSLRSQSSVRIDSNGAPGIELESRGHEMGLFFGFIPLGRGGWGGNVTLDNTVNIRTQGNNAPGLLVESRAGGYPQAGIDFMRNFVPSSAGFTVSSVAGDAAQVGQFVAGSLGGQIQLRGDGSYSVNLGNDFDDLALGQSRISTLSYEVLSANPGRYPSSIATFGVKVTMTDNGPSYVPVVFVDTYGPSTDAAAQVSALPDMASFVNRLLADAGVGGGSRRSLVFNHGAIETFGLSSHGIFVQSKSNRGASGSSGVFNGSSGDPGPPGGPVDVHNFGPIATHGIGAYGIVARSRGGDGGDGGGSTIAGSGGNGNSGGPGGAVTLENHGSVSTEGDAAPGLYAQSLGGAGGNGGGGGALGGSGGSGGNTGRGGDITVDNHGSVTTLGRNSTGLFAQSVGGFPGNGGSATGLVAFGGSGSSAGAGGNVWLGNSGAVTTRGLVAHALWAQSVGGGGGSAGSGSGVVGLGGDGAAGGNGGTVNITNSGKLVASGLGSRGIFGHSIGGGGGDGGDGMGAGAFGGKGSSTSDGNDVFIVNSGAIDASAHAIFAQSVGGGGGNGGSSVGWFSMGGDGGGGGNGLQVSVNNSGSLSTAQTQSSAIFAQSVGGGGGNGGNSVAVGLYAAVAIGGRGAQGGDGRQVSVSSEAGATILTGREIALGTSNDEFFCSAAAGAADDRLLCGDHSHGIFAQSIGGGGGNGGYAVAISAGDKAAVSVSLGGTGGRGGNGGGVFVDNRSAVRTYGNDAYGLLAQSIGGGGGNGGFAVAGNMTFDSASAGLSFAMGGSGGAGGSGNAVELFNGGAISTYGERSNAIFAQSVGGGGGNGGLAVAASFSGPGSKSLNVALGGAGGSGTQGGTVAVDNNGTLETWGRESRGIFAQSVGGGGGNGGMAITAALALGGNNVNIGVSLGGAGGSGSVGDTVGVSNSGAITTHGEASTALYAQSVGGGGGNGGASFAGSVIIAGGQSNQANANVNFAFGGKGGSGNAGGAVNVANHGLLQTWGVASHGVYAQSVGGGGGQGGSSRTMSIILGPSALGASNASFSLSMGGSGGSGGDAGLVSVLSTDQIRTAGVDSHGIFAQSVGAGGGSGGEGAHGFFGVPTIGIDKTPPYRNISVSVGGNAGSAGVGKAVTVNQSGSIATTGDGSFGILAQSVGGGGGTGGVGSIGFTGTIGIGGKGGSAGDGGDVSVTHTGNIDTSGVSGVGIFAQSVGGGGGIAGNIDRGLPSVMNFGVGVGVTLGAGNGGNGGAVTVAGTGNIRTRGEGASAIFAQSVGGGGGVAGSFALGPGYAGSAGGNGAGRAIAVNWTGTIQTDGANSHGIFGQSGGGSASNVQILDADGKVTGVLTNRQNIGSDVAVTVNGSVLANGADANAIFLQSKGADANGKLSVHIAGGTVRGGSGNSAGVHFAEGADNLVRNAGSIGTVLGIGGRAIVAGSGRDTVDNFGTVTGSVDLGTNLNAFRNRAGATFNMGSTVALGAGNALTSDGILAPAGSGVIGTTTLTGNFLQTATGTLAVDVDRAGSAADRVNVSGSAALSGQLAINELHAASARPGTFRYTLVQAAQGLPAPQLGLAFAPSAVNSYALETTSSNELVLRITTDFAPAVAGGVALTRNQNAIGDYINRIQAAGGSPEFASVTAQLASAPDAASLKSIYDQMSAAPYVESQSAALSANQRFSQALLSCRVREGAQRFVQEGECAWGRALGRFTKRDPSADSAVAREEAMEISAGVQRAINAHWYAGFGLSYEDSQLDSQQLRSNGGRTQFGAILKAIDGAAAYSVSLSAGQSRYRTQRVVALAASNATASSTQKIDFMSSHLRAAYAFERGDSYLRPLVDLGVSRTRLGAFSESGAGAANLNVRSQSATHVSVQPALEIGTQWTQADGALLRPHAVIGVMRYVSGTQPQLGASLQGAPVGVAPMTASGTMDKTFANLTLGVDVLHSDGKNLRLSYDGQLSARSTSHAFAVKVSAPF